MKKSNYPVCAIGWSFACDEMEEIIVPTTISAVDCVFPGLSTSKELLATAQMSEFMEYVKRKYSIIVLIGPGAANLTDLQIVAAHAESVSFVYNARKNLAAGTGQSIVSLSELGAPLVGAIQT